MIDEWPMYAESALALTPAAIISTRAIDREQLLSGPTDGNDASVRAATGNVLCVNTGDKDLARYFQFDRADEGGWR